MNSELDISQASNSSRFDMRSKISRGLSMTRKLIDAFRLHVAGVEGEHAIVEATGEGDRQTRHCKTPLRIVQAGRRVSHTLTASSSAGARATSAVTRVFDALWRASAAALGTFSKRAALAPES